MLHWQEKYEPAKMIITDKTTAISFILGTGMD